MNRSSKSKNANRKSSSSERHIIDMDKRTKQRWLQSTVVICCIIAALASLYFIKCYTTARLLRTYGFLPADEPLIFLTPAYTPNVHWHIHQRERSKSPYSSCISFWRNQATYSGIQLLADQGFRSTSDHLFTNNCLLTAESAAPFTMP